MGVLFKDLYFSILFAPGFEHANVFWIGNVWFLMFHEKKHTYTKITGKSDFIDAKKSPKILHNMFSPLDVVGVACANY